MTDDQAFKHDHSQGCIWPQFSFSLQACILNWRLLAAGGFGGRCAWLFVVLHKVCCDVKIWNYPWNYQAPWAARTRERSLFPCLKQISAEGVCEVCVEFLIPIWTDFAPLHLGITDEPEFPPTFLRCCSPCPVVLHLQIHSICAGWFQPVHSFFPTKEAYLWVHSFALVLSAVSQLHDEIVSRL